MDRPRIDETRTRNVACGAPQLSRLGAHGTTSARTTAVAAIDLRKQLEELHQRMQQVLSDLKDVRAKVAETTEDLEKGAALSRLRAEGEFEP